MLAANDGRLTAAIERQLNDHQYRIEHLRHHPILAWTARQGPMQPQQRRRHAGEQRPVAERPGLALG